MLIGLSLSRCIRDISLGSVDLDQVEYIIAGTKFDTDLRLEQMLDRYAQSHWKENPRRATMVFSLLWRSGRILQPRLMGGDAPNTTDGHWIKGYPTRTYEMTLSEYRGWLEE